MVTDDTFYILSLDGGGARGIYSAQVLAKIEDTTSTPISQCFDLIAGTSTGSIIAAAAAAGIPLTLIVELFEKSHNGYFGNVGSVPCISRVNIRGRRSSK